MLRRVVAIFVVWIWVAGTASADLIKHTYEPTPAAEAAAPGEESPPPDEAGAGMPEPLPEGLDREFMTKAELSAMDQADWALWMASAGLATNAELMDPRLVAMVTSNPGMIDATHAAEGRTVRDVVHDLVNVRGVSTVGPVGGGGGGGGGGTAPGAGGSGAPVSLADQLLVELVESLMLPRMEADGTVTFSLLGIAQFQIEIERHAESRVIRIEEYSTGVSLTTDAGRGGGETASAALSRNLKPSYESPSLSLRQLALRMILDVVESPLFYLIVIGTMVIYFHRRMTHRSAASAPSLPIPVPTRRAGRRRP